MYKNILGHHHLPFYEHLFFDSYPPSPHHHHLHLYHHLPFYLYLSFYHLYLHLHLSFYRLHLHFRLHLLLHLHLHFHFQMDDLPFDHPCLHLPFHLDLAELHFVEMLVYLVVLNLLGLLLVEMQYIVVVEQLYHKFYEFSINLMNLV